MSSQFPPPNHFGFVPTPNGNQATISYQEQEPNMKENEPIQEQTPIPVIGTFTATLPSSKSPTTELRQAGNDETKTANLLTTPCINCKAPHSSLWVKSPDHPGERVCNACYLYRRKHGTNRDGTIVRRGIKTDGVNVISGMSRFPLAKYERDTEPRDGTDLKFVADRQTMKLHSQSPGTPTNPAKATAETNQPTQSTSLPPPPHPQQQQQQAQTSATSQTPPILPPPQFDSSPRVIQRPNWKPEARLNPGSPSVGPHHMNLKERMHMLENQISLYKGTHRWNDTDGNSFPPPQPSQPAPAVIPTQAPSIDLSKVPHCSNCLTTTTSRPWFKSRTRANELVCNACWQYEIKHGKPRSRFVVRRGRPISKESKKAQGMDLALPLVPAGSTQNEVKFITEDTSMFVRSRSQSDDMSKSQTILSRDPNTAPVMHTLFKPTVHNEKTKKRRIMTKVKGAVLKLIKKYAFNTVELQGLSDSELAHFVKNIDIKGLDDKLSEDKKAEKQVEDEKNTQQ
ncbi:hypothetical protein WICPIJ_008099 [Wickerhamomyces pijperi]|uniref:GATA-type domain-containing protein n=1 Tax=Wickerhamomyces pijperi TaxID=599730 RepID=A0A9P8Q100_WICPI|nr:hypothetical protein WICPIJ_008099 [Wickerhamomyces pijperi]